MKFGRNVLQENTFKCASTDRVGFSIWRHNFSVCILCCLPCLFLWDFGLIQIKWLLACLIDWLMASFHVEKCRHLSNKQEASVHSRAPISQIPLHHFPVASLYTLHRNKCVTSWQLPSIRGSYGETCVMDFGQYSAASVSSWSVMQSC